MPPIRILQVVTYMGRGGLETMLMNYYRNIDREQVQFDFLVHRKEAADYDEEISRLGGRIYHVSRLVPWSKSYQKELSDFFDRHSEYRVIHVHQDCLSGVILKVAKERGIAVRIAHSHSSGATKNWKYIFKQHYMKWIPQYATDLFACGTQAGEWMFGGQPFETIYNAVSTDAYVYSESADTAVRREFGLENALIVGHVGNFLPPKNHRFLVEVFREIAARQSNARLLLVGGGPLEKEIKEQIKAYGLTDRVVLAGIRNDVPRLMQAMNVFVFPSLWEGLPVTMIEAQAAGLACVISDHVSDECILCNGAVTVWRLEDDPAAWAEHILSRATEPRADRREEIRAAGYDIVQAAEKLQAFYLKRHKEAVT